MWSLKKELGNLTKLRLLYLQGTPHITGQIPTELGQLTNLHTLNLSGNALWGDIPTELGKLKKLKYLNLLGNALTGGIPKELGDTIICKGAACPRVWRRSQTSLSGTYRTTSTYGSLRLPKPTRPAACCGRPPPQETLYSTYTDACEDFATSYVAGIVGHDSTAAAQRLATAADDLATAMEREKIEILPDVEIGDLRDRYQLTQSTQ